MSDQEQDKDPVVSSSLSKPLFIWSALLLLSLGWALYDEVYGIRPWKSYEARFAKLYTRYLRGIRPKETRFENEIKATAEYQKLDREMQTAEKAVAAQLAAIDRKVNQELVPRTLALNDPFQEVRGHIGALTYQIETTDSESSKNSKRQEIDALKKEVHTVKLPRPDGSLESIPMTFTQMDKTLQDWKREKAELLQHRVEILKPATELRAQRDKYLSDRIVDVSADTLAGLVKKMDDFPIAIRQIHIKDVDLVDRCESCHLGTREPVELTKAAMGGEEVFVSHPNKELLKIHDPEKFGCTPCHGGNGAAEDSVVKAHGRHKFWLWPMHHRENFEAGCQQCHVKEVVTEMADTLNAGREIFRLRGCMGCHRYEGFDHEPEEMTAVKEVAEERASHLSHGYRQRVGIAQAIVHRPSVVILDEPTSGLDPAQTVEMRTLIRSLRSEHTVLFSSHLLPEVAHVCDRVLILHHGALLGQPKMSELAAVLGMHTVLVRVRAESPGPRELLAKLEGVHAVDIEHDGGGQIEYRLLLNPDVRPQLARTLIEHGFDLLRLDRPELDLETVFLRLTGHKAPALGTKHANGRADRPA